MAHFAEIDNDGIVKQVLVVPDQEEHRGQDFLANDLGLGGTWIQTSYNHRRGAGGHRYHAGDVCRGVPWRRDCELRSAGEYVRLIGELGFRFRVLVLNDVGGFIMFHPS